MWRNKYIRTLLAVSLGLSICLLLLPSQATAITALPTPPPAPGSYGLEATKKQAPPSQGAVISVPGSGSSFTTSPTTVSGTCPSGLLVEVYDNGVMVGSVICTNGSFTVQVTLFAGQNDFTATDFDDLDQTGPATNTVTVSYTNATYTAFGALITLTSNYGRRAASPGVQLTWPLLLSGGAGPYAFSIDWGDGSPADLKSQALAGVVNIAHAYQKAGVYHVTVKVTDANGVTAFLQLVAVANGQVSGPNTTPSSTKAAAVVPAKVLWIPTAVAFALLFPTFWLGRHSQLVKLHKQLQKSVDSYKDV